MGTNQQQDNETVKLKYIIVFYLHKWKYFLISGIVSVLLAAFYLLCYPKTFEIAAKIRMQEDKSLGNSGIGLGEAAGIMRSFGLGNGGTGAVNLDDEWAILSSNQLLRDVVYDLGLDTHKSIFEILCDTLKEARSKYGVDIPWYIMTSEENNEATENFFKEHDFFGYPESCVTFFKQGKLPMLSTEGKILLNEKGQIKEAADGHGGIFQSMLKDGVIYDMKSRGIEWVFIGGVDNVLVNMVDAVLIGLSEDKHVLAAGKSIVKAGPKEKVGVFCKKNGKPSVIEYSEISEEMAAETTPNGELKYGESHILCNLFNIKAIEKISKMDLPYHVAFKKAKYLDKDGNVVSPDSPNAYKFESFLFDAFESLDDMAILRVKREDEFAPVKNAEGVDSPETARKLYTDFHSKK